MDPHETFAKPIMLDFLNQCMLALQFSSSAFFWYIAVPLCALLPPTVTGWHHVPCARYKVACECNHFCRTNSGRKIQMVTKSRISGHRGTWQIGFKGHWKAAFYPGLCISLVWLCMIVVVVSTFYLSPSFAYFCSSFGKHFFCFCEFLLYCFNSEAWQLKKWQHISPSLKSLNLTPVLKRFSEMSVCEIKSQHFPERLSVASRVTAATFRAGHRWSQVKGHRAA